MLTDFALRNAVLDELRWDPRLQSAHVGVEAASGAVTLTGHVDSFLEKRAAETAAARVGGVREVVESLNVQLTDLTARTDDQLAAAAEDRIAWDSSVPEGAVAVGVRDAIITLSGEVDWKFQKDAAERGVSGLLGVEDVRNNVNIRPRVGLPAVGEEIMRVLHRSWFKDPTTIHVSTKDGQVTLTGAAPSMHDRDLAESTAWAAPGVTRVQNNVVVL